uniref:Putative glycosyl transferase n=1 Tax=Sphaerisporangium sp. SANK 60911 TaxID=1354075 RepID=V5YRI7_9ACTN|nr:putative glycosyl transferase [Sphaerisporangium sp. SANK 60911]
MTRRYLVISEFWPWYDDSGPSRRVGKFITALSRAGTVDLYLLCRVAAPRSYPSPWRDLLDRFGTFVSYPRRGLLGRLRSPAEPPELPLRADPRLRPSLTAWVRGHTYTAVWYAHESAWRQSGRPAIGAAEVVDVPVRRDRLWEEWLASGERPRGADGAVARAAREWRSDLDALRGGGTAVTSRGAYDGAAHTRVGDTYPSLAVPQGAEPDGADLLFCGELHRQENTEAAAWFVTHVMPAVRAKAGDARLHLYGRPAEPCDVLSRSPGTLLHDVAVPRAERMSQATVAVQPRLWGAWSQTDALACLRFGLPLVASPGALDGLAACPTSAEAFADRVLALLGSPAARAESVDGARALLAGRPTEEADLDRIAEFFRAL